MPLSVATFNVKNLLPPSTERDRAVLPQKLAFIAAALSECDADVVGLQEVGNDELVRSAVERIPRSGYGEPRMGPADARGIRCAVLSRVPVLAARVHTASALPFPAFAAGDPAPFGARIPLRRGVLHVTLDAPDLGPVDVMVMHFKSPRAVAERDGSSKEREGWSQASPRERAEGALRSLVWRAAEALYVRGLVDEALAVREHIAVIGDLNDSPESPVLRVLRASGEGALSDCTRIVDIAQRFSLIHDGRRQQVDHVLATGPLFSRLESARFLNASLRDHGQPGRAGNEADAMTVDSDHAALTVRFR